MESHRVPVIVVEEELAVGGWREALRGSRRLRIPPQLVLASSRSDRHLWERVGRLGACSVLIRPFNQREVLQVITMAWLSWLEEWNAPEAAPGAAAAAANSA